MIWLGSYPVWLRVILLRSYGWSVADLAEQFMLSPNTIRSIVRGEMMPEGFWLKGVQSKSEEIINGGTKEAVSK
jgi:hypothetical protein